MEFEDVSPEVEREAQRVAAAFGVEKMKVGFWVADNNFSIWQFVAENVIVRCQWSGNFWLSIRVGTYLGKGRDIDIHDCCFWKDYGQQIQVGLPQYAEFMARGLYRLGFEDEAILAQLSPLTAHEKLELRLSLPREFWPQKWLDEEAK